MTAGFAVVRSGEPLWVLSLEIWTTVLCDLIVVQCSIYLAVAFMFAARSVVSSLLVLSPWPLLSALQFWSLMSAPVCCLCVVVLLLAPLLDLIYLSFHPALFSFLFLCLIKLLVRLFWFGAEEWSTGVATSVPSVCDCLVSPTSYIAWPFLELFVSSERSSLVVVPPGMITYV